MLHASRRSSRFKILHLQFLFSDVLFNQRIFVFDVVSLLEVDINFRILCRSFRLALPLAGEEFVGAEEEARLDHLLLKLELLERWLVRIGLMQVLDLMNILLDFRPIFDRLVINFRLNLMHIVLQASNVHLILIDIRLVTIQLVD